MLPASQTYPGWASGAAGGKNIPFFKMIYDYVNEYNEKINELWTNEYKEDKAYTDTNILSISFIF